MTDTTTPQPMTDEPFGYFRALPFGWEQCAETDEGAIALYERPQKAQPAPSGEPVGAEFFAYHADMGVVFFKSESEARECCAENLKEERKEANSTGEWNDDLAESIRYGVVLGKAKFFADSDNPESGDYRMVDSTAPQAPIVPDGYALVPVEPSAAMVDAGVKHENWSSYTNVRAIYRAMLAAAKQGETK